MNGDDQLRAQRRPRPEVGACTVRCRLTELLAEELAGAWDDAVAAGADPADLCTIVAARLSAVTDDRR